MRRILVPVFLFATTLTLSACGGGQATDTTPPTPNVAACEAAMRAQFQRASNDPDAPSGTRPPECNGIDAATLERLAGKVMAATTPSPDITAACKAALEKSLRRYVTSDEKASADMPDACIGLGRKTLTDLVDEVTAEAKGG